MKTTVTPWKHSNFDIIIHFDEHDKEHSYEHALTAVQKDTELKWFRKWHVPLHLVRQQTNPEYLEMLAMQDIVNHGLDSAVRDYPEHQWIWEPYDVKPVADGIQLSLDVYPQVIVLDEKYKKTRIDAYDTTVSDKEVEDATLLLRKQFATYEAAPTITPTTTSRIKLVYKQDQTIMDTRIVYLNDTDFEKEPELLKIFVWKNLDEVCVIDYTPTLPELIRYTKEWQPTTIEMTIVSNQVAVLPEINEEFIKKTFGTNEITSIEQLSEKVRQIIIDNKKEQWLANSIDQYISHTKESFEVKIPQTLLVHELEHRTKKLVEQLGGQENYKRYLDARSQAENDTLTSSISSAAQQSLQRYFIFKKIVELNNLDVNREKQYDAEEKLYEILKK